MSPTTSRRTTPRSTPPHLRRRTLRMGDRQERTSGRKKESTNNFHFLRRKKYIRKKEEEGSSLRGAECGRWGSSCAATMADDLFSIKNEFYLGNYMGAINEAQSGDLELSTPADERDRDVIVRARAREPLRDTAARALTATARPVLALMYLVRPFRWPACCSFAADDNPPPHAGAWMRGVSAPDGLPRAPFDSLCAQIYRSYIALGQYDVVEDEVKEDRETALQAVKLLATFKSKPDMKDMVLMTLKEWLTDSSTGNNPTLQTVAGIVYLELGELEEAAKVLHSGTTLEMVSLQVQVYLRMARVDVAEKSLSLMARMGKFLAGGESSRPSVDVAKLRPDPRVRFLKPETLTPKALNPIPQTQNLRPQTLNPRP